MSSITDRSDDDAGIRLYMLLRLMLLFSVILSLMAYQRSGAMSSEVIIRTYLLTFFTFMLTAIFVFSYEKAKLISYFLPSQVAYDILFTTTLIYYTGPFDSIYTVFYLFNIMFASIMFKPFGATIAAIASAVLYGGIAWITIDLGSKEGKAFSLLTVITGFISLSLLTSQLVEELRKSRQRANRFEELGEEIVDSLDCGLITVDSRGLVLKMSKTAEMLLELDLKKIREKIEISIQNIIPKFQEILNGELSEIVVGNRMARMLITKVNLPDGKLLVLLRDLTEVLGLEEKLRRQERLAGIGRLAAGVAHEIRNPIASISGAAQLLNSKETNTSEVNGLSTLIVRECDRVDRLVAQLLRFSKPARTKQDRLDIKQILVQCIEAIRARSDFKEIPVDLKLRSTNFCEVTGCSDELSEVFTNLLVNSMQAFAGYKNSSARNEIRIEIQNHKDQVKVILSDNGPGIPKEFRNRVFDPFFTTKETGTGLGLAQVNKIVRDYGGQVDLDSKIGKGTVVSVSLPCRSQREKEAV